MSPTCLQSRCQQGIPSPAGRRPCASGGCVVGRAELRQERSVPATGKKVVGCQGRGRARLLQTWGLVCPNRFVLLYLVSAFLPLGFQSRRFRALREHGYCCRQAGSPLLSTAVRGRKTQLLAELQVSQKCLARVFLLQGPVLWLIFPEGAYI